MAKTAWGILGAGRIARRFAKGLGRVRDAELVAVASRNPANAEGFCKRFRIPRAHRSYEDLTGDPAVDAIYVATPPAQHRSHTLLCLGARKAVLCEKPFALSAVEAEEMIGRARAEGVFLMEAMWSRFLPAWVKLRELLADGAVGEPLVVRADCTWRNPWRPEHRLFDLAAGGGALLDLGVYGISLASMVFGAPPDSVSGTGHIGGTGVDEQGSAVLGWSGGRLAAVTCAIRTRLPNEAVVAGSEATVRLRDPFWSPAALTIESGDRRPRRVSTRFREPGHQYEAEEVGRCLRDGLLESSVIPLDESLGVLRTMDRIRELWGLRYPAEAAGRSAAASDRG